MMFNIQLQITPRVMPDDFVVAERQIVMPFVPQRGMEILFGTNCPYAVRVADVQWGYEDNWFYVELDNDLYTFDDGLIVSFHFYKRVKHEDKPGSYLVQVTGDGLVDDYDEDDELRYDRNELIEMLRADGWEIDDKYLEPKGD